MKKLSYLLILLISVLMLSSCMTTSFDINNLQPNDYELSQKLPNLNILNGESTYIGNSESVSTSSYVYTIFKRELQKNVLDTSTEPVGDIEMVLTYNKIDWDIMWMSKNNLVMEFDINIYDKDHKLIWTNTYSSSETFPTKMSDTYGVLGDTKTVQLEHKLIDMFKDDVKRDYNNIINKLK